MDNGERGEVGKGGSWWSGLSVDGCQGRWREINCQLPITSSGVMSCHDVLLIEMEDFAVWLVDGQ